MVPDSLSGPLRPPEVAAAAVFGGLTVALTLVGWFVPHATAVSVLAVLPMAVVAHRYRTRAVVASTVAAIVSSFLVAGTGPLAGVVACAVIGGLVGHARRKDWGYSRTMALATFVVGPIFSLAVDGAFLVFSNLRRLTLEQLRNSLHGLATVVARLPGLEHLAKGADHDVNVAVRYWWITLPVVLIFYSFGVASLTWQLMIGVLGRLELIPLPDLLDVEDDTRRPAPLAAVLDDVSYRYPEATSDALHRVSLAVEPGSFVAVLGHNGSGKSTLVRLLAGRSPTAGALHRPGAVGLGLMEGTAVVAQRPETQVLGVRVADDVVWGLPWGTEVPVGDILATVGLGGMEDRETATLSGGELQRVAVAAALARRPRLLLSDESTAMVDAEGRVALIGLLARLPSTTGTTVVHVTHRGEEVRSADRVIRLERGRVLDPAPAIGGSSAGSQPSVGSWNVDFVRDPLAGLLPVTSGPVVLEVADVSHTYAARTPWANPALERVSFSVHRGDGVLVVGGNGSGKTSLAWIMAGLMVPTNGVCLLDGRPVRGQVGRVSLAFQHARLQLQRATVLADVRHAAGVDGDTAEAALRKVGLDPDEVGERPVDQLSGGQMRRVALAGLLAGEPRVLILDEPLAGLDGPTRVSLCALLADLRRRSGVTLVVISHDLEGMETVCDRMVRLERGRVVADGPMLGRREVPVGATVGGGSGSAGVLPARPAWTAGAGAPPPAVSEGRGRGGVRRRRKPASVVLLRQVPGDTPVHRLWAGTKLMAVAALSLTLSFQADWAGTALLGAVVMAAVLLARIPRRAVPRLPLGFWVVVAVGAVLTLISGGSPYVTVAGARIGFGDLESFALFTALSVVLLAASLLVGWTTSVAEIAPSVARLARPLRVVHVPVDEWAVTLALCIRSFPLLLDELRILIAARRLRPRPTREDGKRDLVLEAVDLFSASLVAALRRADEMGDAIRARGGMATLSARPSRPARRDAIALAVVLAGCVGAFLLPT
jgi:energy-coupling factor transporter ATP-binding protein EcfA2/energy-coupling factor transporter transmembrane protein EcfT